jgi:hypothetical protein
MAQGHAWLGKSSGGPSSDPWSVSALPAEVSLRRVATASPIRGWRWASHDYFSHPKLALGELWLHLPPRDGFGWVMTPSPVELGWTINNSHSGNTSYIEGGKFAWAQKTLNICFLPCTTIYLSLELLSLPPPYSPPSARVWVRWSVGVAYRTPCWWVHHHRATYRWCPRPTHAIAHKVGGRAAIFLGWLGSPTAR